MSAAYNSEDETVPLETDEVSLVDNDLKTASSSMEQLTEDGTLSSGTSIADYLPPINREEDPPDRHHFIYLCFVLMAIGVLLPYNAIIAATDYFKLIFPDNRVEFDFLTSYMIPNVVAELLGIKYGPKFSLTSRIVAGYLSYLIILVAIPISGSLYPILIVGMVAMGLGDAVVQTGTQGYAGIVGELYPQAFQVGLGVSGIIASILRIITKLSLPENEEGLKTSTTIFFFVSSLIVLACLGVYFWSLRTEKVKYHLSQAAGSVSEVSNEDWRAKINVDLRELWSKVKVPMSMLAVNFFISLGIYPGTVTQIQSTSPELNTTAWFAIIQITLFNIFDFIGKLVPKWYSYNKLAPRVMHIINVSRILFWVVFIAGAKGAFQNDWMSYILISVFAFVNGYAGSYYMMYVFTLVDKSEREPTTISGNASIVFGLSLGSIASLILKKLLFP